ncbi:MAG: DUF4149 domain-containing protein [Thermodesulfobacteriota bacterium]
MNKLVSTVYNLILGVALGSTFALAAFVAPVIFNSDLALGRNILSRFQEGLVMIEIFKRYCNLLNLTVVIVLLMEGIKFTVYRNRDYLRLGAAIVVLVSSALFTFYFTPEIIQAQANSPDVKSSEVFQTLHRASVIDFSFIMVSLAVLMVKMSFTEKKT